MDCETGRRRIPGIPREALRLNRTNQDRKRHSYKFRQASEHFIPFVRVIPKWFIDCGPGSAWEFQAANRAWPNARILGLEPSPVGYRAALNRWPKGGILLPVAAWDRDEPVRLYYPQDLLHGTAFFDGERNINDDVTPAPTDDWLEVQGRSLDSLDREYGPFEQVALWMDIEGAERRALRGAKNLLDRGEIVAVNVEVRPDSYREVKEILTKAGLKFVRDYFACETVRDEVWTI